MGTRRMRRRPRLRIGVIASFALMSVLLHWGGPSLAQSTTLLTEDDLIEEEGSFFSDYKTKSDRLRVRHEVLWVRPFGNGPFPLAVISHGTPRDMSAAARRRMRPQTLYFVAEEMAKRGWAAAIFMRRGYGETLGVVSDGYGPCSRPNFLDAANSTAQEFNNAIQELSKAPFVNPTEIIAIGHSAGGFGALALSGKDVPGLRAVINFGGGRASIGGEVICGKDQLIAAFRAMGTQSKIPSLWIYAKNDSFFRPDVAVSFFESFARMDLAQLHIIDAVADDGHRAIQSAGGPLWLPKLDLFLIRNSLRRGMIEAGRIK